MRLVAGGARMCSESNLPITEKKREKKTHSARTTTSTQHLQNWLSHTQCLGLLSCEAAATTNNWDRRGGAGGTWREKWRGGQQQRRLYPVFFFFVFGKHVFWSIKTYDFFVSVCGSQYIAHDTVLLLEVFAVERGWKRGIGRVLLFWGGFHWGRAGRILEEFCYQSRTKTATANFQNCQIIVLYSAV